MDLFVGYRRLSSLHHSLTFINSSKSDRVQQVKRSQSSSIAEVSHEEPKVCQPVILYCISTDMKPNPPLNPSLHPTRQGVLPNP